MVHGTGARVHPRPTLGLGCRPGVPSPSTFPSSQTHSGSGWRGTDRAVWMNSGVAGVGHEKRPREEAGGGR